MPRTLSSMLLCSRATCNSCFQTEHVYGSAFSDQTVHFWILIPIQNYIVSVSSVVPRNLLIDLVTPCLMEVLQWQRATLFIVGWFFGCKWKNNKWYT